MRDSFPYLREVALRKESAAERREEFDKEFGTDTSEAIWPWDLPSLEKSGSEVHGYQPLAAGAIRAALSALPEPLEEFEFIDLGSGKGRAVLIATEFAFARVVGVELSRELNDIACRNFSLYHPIRQRCRNVEFVCQDAVDFAFPPRPIVLFMYNPFGQVTLERVLDNLKASLAQVPRRAFVVYANPLLAKVVRRAPYLRQRQSSPDLLICEAIV